ncbi:hypothetical protein V2I01_26710 [Micromonospora sp. BRA006-A]|nr:hypothetical protein [Micromonospora sp. BRA006-A]
MDRAGHRRLDCEVVPDDAGRLRADEARAAGVGPGSATTGWAVAASSDRSSSAEPAVTT